MEAATGCHLPNPRGAKIGARIPPKDSHDTVVAVLNKSDSASCISDAGKDPHDNGCKEKNGTSFDDEAFQSLPNMKQNCLTDGM